jgi:rhodanese-related sulfurtransferase
MNTVALTPDMTMAQVLALCPGSQRALFRRYHIGGCSSCAFQPDETLADLCGRHPGMEVAEAIAHLQSSHEQDERMMLSPSEIAHLRSAGHVMKLVDVRTREEWEAVRIEGAEHLTQAAMQSILGQWPRESLLVVYDHRGNQGLDAAAYFQGQGFSQVKCMRGGIDAWSRDVDRDLPRYELA